MGKFYSYQKNFDLRAQISTFSQMEGEPFHDAWYMFKLFLIECSNHSYPLQLQNQFSYNRLIQQCQLIIDKAMGSAIREKNTLDTFNLFEIFGVNSQQKRSTVKRARTLTLKYLCKLCFLLHMAFQIENNVKCVVYWDMVLIPILIKKKLL